MKINIVQIGNSRGIRIPKALLEQCQLQDAVELEMRDGHLVIRGVTKRRSSWDYAFRQMHEHGDDALVDEGALSATEWDTTEWECSRPLRSLLGCA